MSFNIDSQIKANLAHFYTLLKVHILANSYSKNKQIEYKDNMGVIFGGKVQAISPKDQLILLKNIKKRADEEIVESKVLKLNEITYLKFPCVQNSGFKTDSETINSNIREKKEKTLIRWNEAQNHDNSQKQMSVDQNLDETIDSKVFDQFEAIQQRFGLVPTFDENSYTTSINYNQIDEAMRKYAEQQVLININIHIKNKESEVFKQSSLENNKHILEERNLKPLEDEEEKLDEDEEAKYSAVIGSGNYKKKGKKQKKAKQEKTQQQEEEQAVDESVNNKEEQKNQVSMKFYNSNKISQISINEVPKLPQLKLKPIEEVETKPKKDIIKERRYSI